MSWANQVIPSTIATWPSKTSVEGLVSDLNGAPISGGGGGGGSVITGLIANLAGAAAQDVSFVAPTSPGGTITGYSVQSYRLSDNTLVASAYDETTLIGSPTATTRRIKGLPAGGQYYHKVAAIVNGVTGTYSGQSTTLAIPTINQSAPINSVVMFGIYGLPYTPTNVTTSDVSYQINLGLPFDFDSMQVLAFNFSRAAAATYKLSGSSPTVMSTYPLQGGSVGTGGLTALNNGGSWFDFANLSVPASTAVDDATALYSPGVGLSEIQPVVRNARTDGGVGGIAALRVVEPTGSQGCETTWMPSVGSGSNWLPGQEVAGGQLNGHTMRVYRMPAVDAIANKAAFTAAGTFARVTQAPPVFIILRLRGVVQGVQALFPGDSRVIATVPPLNSGVGLEMLSWAQADTAAHPMGYVNLGLSGKNPGLWLTLLQAIASYIPKSTTIVPKNSINYYGGGPNIVQANYTQNEADCNSIVTLLKGLGHRTVRSTTIGVDTINGSYHWIDDITWRHNPNIAFENASTADNPVIPLGTLYEGPIETTNNSYTVASKDGSVYYLDTTDATRAHPTNAAAQIFYPFMLPYLIAP